jgi:hypothetical protein
VVLSHFSSRAKEQAMSIVFRKLNSGHYFCFNPATKDLFMIEPEAGDTLEPANDDQLMKDIQRLVQVGAAKYFDRGQLVTLQAALANIVTLI